MHHFIIARHLLAAWRSLFPTVRPHRNSLHSDGNKRNNHKEMFDDNADLVMKLEKWKDVAAIDRLGIFP